MNQCNLENISDICRICLEKKNGMFSIFDKYLDGCNEPIFSIIMDCASVQITKGDGLPELLCNYCRIRLETAYLFKRDCEQSDSKLRQIINTRTDDFIDEEDIKLETKIELEPEIDTCDYSVDDIKSEDPLASDIDEINNDEFSTVIIKEENEITLHSNNEIKPNMKSEDEYFPNVCYNCGKRFHWKSNLERHLKVLSVRGKCGEKPRSNSKHKDQLCTYCGKTFWRPGSLKTHVRIHKGEKSFKCDKCDFCTYSKGLLQAHIINHTSDRPNKSMQVKEPTIPIKSKTIYEQEYTAFCNWRDKKMAKGADERIVLDYISERSNNVKSSSLWALYSKLNKMLLTKENVDISRFSRVKAFLRQRSAEYIPRKLKVFTREDLEKFLDTAPDSKYLLLKVVCIMGVVGRCRPRELVKLTIDDIDDRGNVLVVKIVETETSTERIFTVINGNNSVHAIDIFRKYRKLRPNNVSHNRFFLNYQNEKCTVQPVGLNTFAKMPHKIAEFLNLSNSKEYSFRRTSATLLMD